MARKLAIALAVVLLALGGVAVAAYYGLIPLPWLSKPPEYSARYYPSDTLAYTWFTLWPSSDQRNEAGDIWSRLDDQRAFRNLVEDFEDLVEGETGFEIEEDILSWMGAEVSAAVLDFDTDSGEVDAAMTIDVRDSEETAAFLEALRDYLEDVDRADYDRDTINDLDVWLDEESGLAHSLTPDLMIFASSERTMEDVLDRVAGESSRTLASNERFMEARAAMPERRFMSGYADYRGLMDALDSGISDNIFGLDALEDSCNEALAGIPDWAAFSAAWVDSGFVFDFVSPTVNTLWPPSPNVSDAADALPAGTLGFISLGFDPNLDNWREPLRECTLADLIPDWADLFEEIERGILDFIESASLLDSPDLIPKPRLDQGSTLADALDLGLWTVNQLTGVHLEEDFLNYLVGDLILALHDVSEVDVESLQPSDADAALFDGIAIIPYRPDNESALRATIDGFLGRFVTKPPSEVDVGADEPARIYPLKEFHSEGYGLSPGYVLHDGLLIIGSTKEALDTTVSLRNGEGEPLSANAEYLRATSHLPEERQLLMYVDIGRVFDLLDLGNWAEDDDLGNVLADNLSAMAMSTHTDDYSRATMALTLFPGE